MPPEGLGDWEDAFRPCITSDPYAACAYTSREAVESQKVARLSPTSLLAVFLDGSSKLGTVVLITVVHHFPDQWSLHLGAKQVVNAGTTSNIDVAALSESTAVVAFADDATSSLQARVVEVADGALILGETALIAGNVSLVSDNNTEANVSESNWTFAPTHRRLSVAAVDATRALVASAPPLANGEVILLSVNGLNTTRATAASLRSPADDITMVFLGGVGAMCVYRDDVEGFATAQEVEVYENFNGEAHALTLGSTSIFTAFPVEGLVATALNRTGLLVAYRAADGRGMTTLIGASFNAV